MDCDLYADLELSNSEGEDDRDENSRLKTNQAEMDLMDEGLTNKFKPTVAPKSAPLPRVDIEVVKLKHEVASLREQNAILEKNLVLLYKTAHHVFTLKDKELNNLKTKYDAMCFRRRDQANPSALPSIAPQADQKQKTDARARNCPPLVQSSPRQETDPPKRPAMSKEFSSLGNYAKIHKRTNNSAEVAPSETPEGGSIHKNLRSSDSRAQDRKPGDAKANRRNAVRTSDSSDERKERSLSQTKYRETDGSRRGKPETLREGSRNRSPVGSYCRKELRIDRKRPRGSSEEENQAKRIRNGRQESDEDGVRERSARSECEKPIVAKGVNADCPRSDRDKYPKANIRKKEGEDHREDSADDHRRRRQIVSRGSREVDSSRRERTDSPRASTVEASKRNRSDRERTMRERASERERKKEHSRTSRSSTERGSMRLEDTTMSRSRDSLRNRATESTRQKRNESTDRDPNKGENRVGGAMRNKRIESHRREKVVEKERKGNDGAVQGGDDSSPRSGRVGSQERVSRRESRARDDGSTNNRKRDDRRHDVVSFENAERVTTRGAPDGRRPNLVDCGKNDGVDSHRDENPGKKRYQAIKRKMSSEAPRNGTSVVSTETMAKSGEDVGIDRSVVIGETSPISQTKDAIGDRISYTRGVRDDFTAEHEKTTSSRKKSEGSRRASSERTTRRRRECSQDASVSPRTQPVHSSKPTFESEKVDFQVRSETPTGVQVNQCDSPQVREGGRSVDSATTSAPVTPLRRSPRKSVRSVRGTELRKSKGADSVLPARENHGLEEGEIEESTVESEDEHQTFGSGVNLDAFLRDVIGLRRSPRKSVRDRQVPLEKPQLRGVIESPHVIRPSPTKLHRKIPRDIPADLVGVCEDPRVDREALRPLLLNMISYVTSAPEKESNRPPTFSSAAAMGSSPRRSPRKLQAKRLTEGDATLLESLLDQPPTEHPRCAKTEPPAASLYASPWLDDALLDLSKPPETPGKNLNLSELSIC